MSYGEDDVLVRIQDLRTHFFTPEGVAKAVNGVNLTLRRGRTLAIVGESGCGKTTLALSLMRLVPYPGRVVGGQVLLGGQDILQMTDDQLRKLRGRVISMIFQDPQSGLNPVLSIGEQVVEIITNHLPISKSEAKRQALAALAQMGLPDPERIADSYPFQLSGGMCQRVMIAIATTLNPEVLIADEPTANLDVTVQAGILRELELLKQRQHTAILLITHDLGVVARVADDVAVMYGGSIVESGDPISIFHRPQHPYTWALLSTLPRVDRNRSGEQLPYIRGSPPDLIGLPDECPFLPRCNKAVVACRTQPMPPLEEAEPGHFVACYNPVWHGWEDDESEAS